MTIHAKSNKLHSILGVQMWLSTSPPMNSIYFSNDRPHPCPCTSAIQWKEPLNDHHCHTFWDSLTCWTKWSLQPRLWPHRCLHKWPLCPSWTHVTAIAGPFLTAAEVELENTNSDRRSNSTLHRLHHPDTCCLPPIARPIPIHTTLLRLEFKTRNKGEINKLQSKNKCSYLHSVTAHKKQHKVMTQKNH